MFDLLVVGAAPTVADLEGLLDRLDRLDGTGATEVEQIEYVSLLERLKGAMAAAQARVTDNLARARAASEAERGIPAGKRCQGLAAEIALARRSSPFRGARDLGLARVLVREMPHTHDLLTRGEISEWRATLVVRETAVLSVEHRQQVDAELATKLGASATARPRLRPARSATGSTPGPRSAVPAAPGPTATSACVQPPTP